MAKSVLSLACVLAAATTAGMSHAGNRETWPLLWDRPYLPGESAAVLHEELAPGVWSVFLRSLGDGDVAFRDAGVVQELGRVAVDPAARLDLAWRTDGGSVHAELEVETWLLAAEVYGVADSMAYVSAIVTTITYDVVSSKSAGVYRLHHFDVIDEHEDACAALDALDASALPGDGCADRVGRTLRLDGDGLQVCVQSSPTCGHMNDAAGRLGAICCVSRALDDRARALSRLILGCGESH